ncbi:MAG: helix-turn-helix transcriptional regulator [Oscillospiraceae bacterium]|nr:helix-turn-helix transcriptional regulator [Oscillospiraceae bacterium]
MIRYDPLWRTMQAKNITTYTLITKHRLSRGTLDSLKHNRNISTATLNDLCRMLDCRVEEILEYVPENEK